MFCSPHLSFSPCRQMQGTRTWDCLSVQLSQERDTCGWWNRRALTEQPSALLNCLTGLCTVSKICLCTAGTGRTAYAISVQHRSPELVAFSFTHLNFFTTRNIVLRENLKYGVKGNYSRGKAPCCLYIFLCYLLINPCSQESQHVNGSLWEFTCAWHQQINTTGYWL